MLPLLQAATTLKACLSSGVAWHGVNTGFLGLAQFQIRSCAVGDSHVSPQAAMLPSSAVTEA